LETLATSGPHEALDEGILPRLGRGRDHALNPSVKDECLNRVVPQGGRYLRRTLREFAVHYHHERNHEGLANELIDGPAVWPTAGAVRRRERIGGILSYYYRAAA
jgi:hypothetical protein